MTRIRRVAVGALVMAGALAPITVVANAQPSPAQQCRAIVSISDVSPRLTGTLQQTTFKVRATNTNCTDTSDLASTSPTFADSGNVVEFTASGQLSCVTGSASASDVQLNWNVNPGALTQSSTVPHAVLQNRSTGGFTMEGAIAGSSQRFGGKSLTVVVNAATLENALGCISGGVPSSNMEGFLQIS